MEDVESLIDFLSPFDLGGGTREKDSEMSSSKYTALLGHVAFQPNDSQMVVSLKSVAILEMQVMAGVHVIDQCKTLVTYLNQAGLNNRTHLSSTLKQDICTRWNSQLTMLRSLEKVWDEVR